MVGVWGHDLLKVGAYLDLGGCQQFCPGLCVGEGWRLCMNGGLAAFFCISGSVALSFAYTLVV